MVKVLISNGLSIVVFDASFANRGAFEIFTQIINIGLHVVRGVLEMNDPGDIVELSCPGIEGRIRDNVLEMGRELQIPFFEFCSQEGDDAVSPDIFERLMIEIGFANPCSVEKGKPTHCGGEVNMDIPFEVSAEGMDGKKDTRKKPFLMCPIFDDGCCDKGDKVHKVTIQPEEVPEVFRQSKGNVLPGSSGKSVKTIFNPDVGSLLATGRTKSGFTAMGDFHTLGTRWADKLMVAKERRSAYEEF